MVNLTLTKQIDAPPEVVFDTITDHGAYWEFTPIRRAVLEEPGAEAPNGTGAIRALHVAGPPIRERVTAYERPRLFSYEVLSGVPVKSQTGRVTMAPAASGSGTDLRYDLEIEPLVPFSGPVAGAFTKLAIGRLLTGVAAEAEKRAAATAVAV